MNVILLSPLHATAEAAARAQAAWLAGRRLTPPARAAVVGGRPLEQVSGLYARAGRVGIISVRGVMEFGESPWAYLFGGVTSSEIADAIRVAADDPSTDVILFDIESPGGDVAGVDDLERAVVDAKAKKYIAAIAHDTCCSAAYWLASAADELVATPTAIVGSIGVLLGPIIDSKKMAEDQGLIVHYVSSGDLKAPGQLGQAVTPEQVDNLRGVVDSLFSRFAAAVTAGRDMDEDEIRSLRGGIFSGDAATSNGLVDRIVSFDEYTTALLQRAERRQLRASTPASARVRRPVSIVGTHGDPAMALTPEQWASIDASALSTNRPDLVASIGSQAVAKVAEPPATVKALREAFAGDAEFALKAAEDGMSLLQARAAYADVLRARVVELEAAANTKASAAAKVAADVGRKVGTIGTVTASELGVDPGETDKAKPKKFWDYVGEIQASERLSKAAAILAVKERFPKVSMFG